MANSIIAGNDFRLIIRAKKSTGAYLADMDLADVEDLRIYLTRAGRSKVLQSYTLDEEGHAVIYVSAGVVTNATYGIEMVGVYGGARLRAHNTSVFTISGHGGGNSGVLNDYYADIVFVINVAATDVYVQNAIEAHNENEASHPHLLQLIEEAGDVDDVQIDGESIVDENKIAKIDSSQFGKVDDVKVNGTSVVSNKEADITIPEKVSDLPNDAEYATQSELTTGLAAKQDTITAVAEPTIADDGGNPSASVEFEGGEMAFAFRNLKLRFSDLTAADKAELKGDKGDQGDSAVYDPSSPDAPDFVMANTTGQSTTKAMTQKAVTDELEKKIEPITGNTGHDLDITDLYGNIIASFLNGHLETKECSYVVSTSSDGVFIADNDGYIFGWLVNGHFISKNYNTIAKDEFYLIKKPQSPIEVYNTCNDIDKTSNKWGINSRNYGLSVYLDHFISSATIEKKAFFDKNKKTFVNISQSIEGYTETWNEGQNVLSKSEEYSLNEGVESLQIVKRTVLNTAAQDLFPKVLQIGDSVTEGWFANYPTMQSTPSSSWQWAKYFFAKDKAQKGTGYDSLFIGTLNKVDITYDDVQVKGYAEGRGGWTPQTYWSSSASGGKDNAFYDSTLKHFSLASYLNKYKTIADDGVTRLVVGSTAGTSVTNINAYDVCTPNIVVIQLGMNGTLAIYREYVANIIRQIKSEFPDMKIIISCLDAALCMFPSIYPEYDGIFLSDYDGAHARMMNIAKWVKDTLPTLTYTADGEEYEMTEENGIYGVYTGAVMPMPYSCNVREIINPLSSLQEGLRRYVGVDAIERVKHPSRFAHMAVGYELYSAIKWVLLN